MIATIALLLREGGGQFSIGFVFWLIMLLWIILGFVWGRPLAGVERNRYIGGSVLAFVLFFILGWATFGFPIG